MNDVQKAQLHIAEGKLADAARAANNALSEPAQVLALVNKANAALLKLREKADTMHGSGNYSTGGIHNLLADDIAAAEQELTGLRAQLNKRAEAIDTAAAGVQYKPGEFTQSDATLVNMYKDMPQPQRERIQAELMTDPNAHPELAAALARCPAFASPLSPRAHVIVTEKLTPPDLREKQSAIIARADLLKHASTALNAVEMQLKHF